LSNKRESKQDRLREQYYEKNQDKFFTSESTHSPTYDFAESFLAFVINDRPPELGKKIDEKMDFFYSFEELVDTREKIRVKFTSSLD